MNSTCIASNPSLNQQLLREVSDQEMAGAVISACRYGFCLWPVDDSRSLLIRNETRLVNHDNDEHLMRVVIKEVEVAHD